MLSLDDVLDLAGDAITRKPDDPVAQPLFECFPVGERKTGYVPNSVSQEYEIRGFGRVEIMVAETE